MRAAIIALMLMIGSQAGAGCGNLCDNSWWETATEADVQAELDGGSCVMARDHVGMTPLHWAALHDAPASIQALLAAGADAKAKNKNNYTATHKTDSHGL